jgi:hypothetical protein
MKNPKAIFLMGAVSPMIASHVQRTSTLAHDPAKSGNDFGIYLSMSAGGSFARSLRCVFAGTGWAVEPGD